MARERRRPYPPGVRPLAGRPGWWRVRVWTLDPKTGRRREVQRHFQGSEAEAVLFRAREAAAVEAPGRPRRATLAEYATTWIDAKADRGASERTLDMHAANLDDHILPTFGAHFIDSITAGDVDEWVRGCARVESTRGRPYNPNTINGWLGTLKQVLRAWARDNDRTGHPAQMVEPLRLTRDPDAPPNSLTPEQLRAVLAHMREREPQWFAYYFTGSMTGMRPGELAALDWPDVDEAAGVIRITKTWRGPRLGIGPTKTRRTRTAPLTPEMAAVLREHRAVVEDRQRRRLVRGAGEASPDGVDIRIVFPGPRDGRRLGTNVPHTAIQRAAEACGVAKLTPKSMRRTFNDLMRIAGVEGIVLRSIVGHTSQAMTDTYSTVRRDEQADAVARVVSIVAGRGPDTKPDTNG